VGSQLVENCSKVQLSAVNKLVLLAYAHRSHDNKPECGAWPSLASIMEFASCSRATAERAVSRLKKEGMLLDTGDRKGSTGKVKAYRISPDVLKGEHIKCAHREQGNVLNGEGEMCSKVRYGTPRELQVEVKDPTATDLFAKQMEEELLALWNYHQEAFDRNDRFTPQRQKQGFARLRDLVKRGEAFPGYRLVAVIDIANHIHKSSAKWYMAEWHCLFGKQSTCLNLLNEYDEMSDPPAEAAEWTGRKPEVIAK